MDLESAYLTLIFRFDPFLTMKMFFYIYTFFNWLIIAGPEYQEGL